MNKIKKIVTSVAVFIVGIISKVYAIGTDTIISVYAVDPGPKEKAQTVWSAISKIGRITIPVVLFVIGLFVILSKKLTKKIKAITISVLVIIGIISIIIMNYFA